MPTNNTVSNAAVAAKLPHRRVLLTQPSNELDSAAVAAAIPSVATSLENDATAVRVVAYLTQEEGQRMDQTWLQMRGFGIRASKADIVRAALLMALDNEDTLRAALQPAAVAKPAAPHGRK